jgi:hypothetical protein
VTAAAQRRCTMRLVYGGGMAAKKSPSKKKPKAAPPRSAAPAVTSIAPTGARTLPWSQSWELRTAEEHRGHSASGAAGLWGTVELLRTSDAIADKRAAAAMLLAQAAAALEDAHDTEAAAAIGAVRRVIVDGDPSSVCNDIAKRVERALADPSPPLGSEAAWPREGPERFAAALRAIDGFARILASDRLDEKVRAAVADDVEKAALRAWKPNAARRYEILRTRFAWAASAVAQVRVTDAGFREVGIDAVPSAEMRTAAARHIARRWDPEYMNAPVPPLETIERTIDAWPSEGAGYGPIALLAPILGYVRTRGRSATDHFRDEIRGRSAPREKSPGPGKIPGR